MKSAILSFATILAAVTAVWLGLRPPQVRLADVDPADGPLSQPGRNWTEPVPVTMDQAVADLSKASGVRIVLDWPDLSAARVSRKLMKLNPYGLDGTSVRSTLKCLANQYSSQRSVWDMKSPLKFSITSDSALLVSIDHADGHQLRIYDVQDLLTDDYWGAPSTIGHDEKSRSDDLITLLQSRLDPGEVQTLPSGSMIPVNRIDPFVGRLLITTTPTEHRRIERILDSLRQLRTEGTH